MGNKISGKDFIKLGFPNNNSINIVLGQIHRYRKKEKKQTILNEAKENKLDRTNLYGSLV